MGTGGFDGKVFKDVGGKFGRRRDVRAFVTIVEGNICCKEIFEDIQGIGLEIGKREGCKQKGKEGGQ